MSSWWTWCRKLSPRWYSRCGVLNSSMSQSKLMNFPIGIVPIHVWGVLLYMMCPPTRIYEYIPYKICVKSLRKQTMTSTEDIWVHFLLDMCQNLAEVDQEFQRGYMSIFLIGYVLKAWGSRPWAPKRIYEYIPYQICLEILRKYTRSSTEDIWVYSLLNMC